MIHTLIPFLRIAQSAHFYGRPLWRPLWQPLGGHWVATGRPLRRVVMYPSKLRVKRMFAFWEKVLAAALSPMLPAGKISDNAHSHFTPRACGGELSSSGAARRDRPGRTYPAGLPAAVLANSLAEAHNILAVRPFRQVCTWAQGWILRLPHRIRARPPCTRTAPSATEAFVDRAAVGDPGLCLPGGVPCCLWGQSARRLTFEMNGSQESYTCAKRAPSSQTKNRSNK